MSYFTVVNTILDSDLNNISFMYDEDLFDIELDKIGQGAFGEVYKYKALDGTEYAIKVSAIENDCCYVAKAMDIETLSLLQGYDNIMKLYAYYVDEDSDRFVMIMDYIDGVTLEDYEDGCVDIDINPSFIDHFQGIVDVFIENNVEMADIHNANIMIDSDGLPVLIDFGGFYQVDNTNQNDYERAMDIVCDFFNCNYDGWKVAI